MTWVEVWEWVQKKAIAYLSQPAGGFGVVEDLGSGYSVEGDRMQNVEKLKLLQMEAVTNPEWISRDVTGDGKPETFCNYASRFIAEGMGCLTLKPGVLANAMIEAIQIDGDWREDTIERAHAHALKGGLAFLTLSEWPHGHLCSISPEPMQDSGTWGRKVPIVANVGPAKSHGIVKASVAFKAADAPMVRAFLWGETA